MNCKWFEVFFFFLFLASENLCAPKCCGRQKGKLHLCTSEGGGGGTDVLFCCCVKCCVSHPQSFARHPTEWGPTLLFWVIHKPHPWGLWSSGRGGLLRLRSIVLPCTSDFISCEINGAFLPLCIKSSTIPGLCLAICVSQHFVNSSPRNMPGSVC